MRARDTRLPPMAEMIEKRGCNSCLGGKYRLTDMSFATLFDIKSGTYGYKRPFPPESFV